LKLEGVSIPRRSNANEGKGTLTYALKGPPPADWWGWRTGTRRTATSAEEITGHGVLPRDYRTLRGPEAGILEQKKGKGRQARPTRCGSTRRGPK